jgi:hypothetical protein
VAVAKMGKVKLRLYRPAVTQYLREPSGEVGVWLRGAGEAFVILAKAQAGRKTGRLQKSIRIQAHARRTYGQEMKIGSRVKHALVHHEGSRPHTIQPHKGQALKFRQSGKMVFYRAVRHPGTKPNRYLTDNLKLFSTL